MIARVATIVGLVCVGVVGRLVPHLPNATPIAAITVTAGRYVGPTGAIVIPLVSMLLSDIVIGFYDWRILLSVYFSIACMGLLSIVTRHSRSAIATSVVIMGSSLLFFVITNAAVWAFSPWFEKSLSGLLYSYELGLPFLRSMMLGDLVYTPLLLGAAECIAFLAVLARHRQIRPAYTT